MVIPLKHAQVSVARDRSKFDQIWQLFGQSASRLVAQIMEAQINQESGIRGLVGVLAMANVTVPGPLYCASPSELYRVRSAGEDLCVRPGPFLQLGQNGYCV